MKYLALLLLLLLPLQARAVDVHVSPSNSNLYSIAPVKSASAENNHVLLNRPGNLYSVYATNLTTTAGFLLVFDATSAPADGAVTPTECVGLSGVVGATTSLNLAPGPMHTYSTGIVAVVSSASTCFTKTTGVITAFISGSVQ